MNIHSVMGFGFLEAVYAEVLKKEFIKNNIPYQREVKLDLFFNGEKLEKKYKADFVCFENIILEIKSVSFLHDNFSKQTLNYLKATNKKLGLLINFGERSLKHKRIINL
ncbi:MAG: GxxExxY protein [Chryseobacterium sp.]|nr:GxxExxY protein [Candidatus Chryseobacterium enterohippi]